MPGLNGALGQTQVFYQPSPAVSGDFASANTNRFTVLAGPGGLVAGPQGLTVGLFAWLSSTFLDANGSPQVANNFGVGLPAGFVHRDQPALITQYLVDASMVVPAGFPVTLFDSGDFWVVNNGTTQALPGQSAYANFANGQVSFAAAGSLANSTATTFAIVAETFSVTGGITNNIMTLTAVGSGVVQPGSVLSANAQSAIVLAQVSGTPGGIGVYTVSVPEQSLAPLSTITGTWGQLTVGGTVTGSFPLGAALSGTSVPAGATITANGTNGVSLTGTGGAGTYVTQTATASSGTLTAATDFQTKFAARSAGQPGELVKMSSTAFG